MFSTINNVSTLTCACVLPVLCVQAAAKGESKMTESLMRIQKSGDIKGIKVGCLWAFAAVCICHTVLSGPHSSFLHPPLPPLFPSCMISLLMVVMPPLVFASTTRVHRSLLQKGKVKSHKHLTSCCMSKSLWSVSALFFPFGAAEVVRSTCLCVFALLPSHFLNIYSRIFLVFVLSMP